LNKNKIISIGFVSLAALLGVSLTFFGNSIFVIGVFSLVLYVYYSFLIAPKNKKFMNVKQALQHSDISNEELSEMTTIDPEKINLLRVNNEFSEQEIESLAVALEVKEDRSAQRNGKRAIMIVVVIIAIVCLVYFLFGDNTP
jgi:cbb3-type cytochrome oxidase subunit 3